VYNWKQALLRQLPGVDVLLEKPEIKELMESYPRGLVLESIREALEDVRTEIISLDRPREPLEVSMLVNRITYLVEKKARPNLRRVINATGIILHTNLGRAVLSRRAVEALQVAAQNYTNLEIDLGTGERGSRFSHVEKLLTRLTGAEDCMVVNNNAGAVLLALNTLAKEKEVIVSRGQLVEIGGAFRIPEVMEQSGAKLVEVGTTNRTYPSDYRRAVNENTGLLLLVHTSNYRIVGFTRETTPAELVEVAREVNLPVMEDLGSGCLVDLELTGIRGEPTVTDIIESGVDVVTFSGDKLLGGPQAGIIVGKKKYVSAMKRNPLARALRVDKLTVAALEATLREYLEGIAEESIPTLKMLTLSKQELSARAEELQYRINVFTGIEAEIAEGTSQAGGGALPALELPTYLVLLRVPGMTPERLVSELREGEPPVIAMIRGDHVVFDVRTIREDELPITASCVARVIQ